MILLSHNLAEVEMKLVFNPAEVAAALQLSESEFANLRPKLEAMGFPLPVRGLQDRWAIIEVIRWVNNENETGKASLPDSH
jgi:hypothetical protein